MIRGKKDRSMLEAAAIGEGLSIKHIVGSGYRRAEHLVRIGLCRWNLLPPPYQYERLQITDAGRMALKEQSDMTYVAADEDDRDAAIRADERKRCAEELTELDASRALGSSTVDIEWDSLIALIRRWHPELADRMEAGDAD